MLQDHPKSYRSGPDDTGHFGIFGGRFVAETLMPLVLDLEKAYATAKADPSYQAELDHLGPYPLAVGLVRGGAAGVAATEASLHSTG